MKSLSRSFLPAALLVAVWFPSAMLGQSTGSQEFGNWLGSYQVNAGAYQTKPCIPSVFPFTVSVENALVSGYAGCQPGGGQGGGQSGAPTMTAYLASVIPTPGLTSSSTCGTTGVRCAADAHFAVTGQGEGLRQARPKSGGPEAVVSKPIVPLPTFRMLPFPPVFPNLSATPPEPACGTGNEYTLLVVEHLNNRVGAIGGCSATVIANIPVTSRPLEIKLLPDGSQAIVTSFDNAISFIDVASNTVAATIPTSVDVNPSGIAVSPDGTRAYVTNYTDPGASLLTIDVQRRQIIQTLPLDSYPQSVFLNGDGSLAWITFPFNNEIAVVDTLTNTIVKTLSADTPFGVAFNSTGTLAFVPARVANAVEVFDTKTYAFLRRIPVGAGPAEVGIAPDDSFAIATNFDGNSLTVINLSDYSTNTVSLPGSPDGLSIRSSN
jgi:DNA-binding beta-propeller fold protein YncE